MELLLKSQLLYNNINLKLVYSEGESPHEQYRPGTYQPTKNPVKEDDTKTADHHVEANGFYPAEHFYNSYPASQFQDFNHRRLEETNLISNHQDKNLEPKKPYLWSSETFQNSVSSYTTKNPFNDGIKSYKYISPKPDIKEYPKRPNPSSSSYNQNLEVEFEESLTYSSTTTPSPYSTSNRYEITYSTTPRSKYLYPTPSPTTPKSQYNRSTIPSYQFTRPTTLSYQYTRPTSPSYQYTRPTTPRYQYTRPTTPIYQYNRPTTQKNRYTRRTTPKFSYTYSSTPSTNLNSGS